ncbi:MAG: N-acyl homoserine lactonase family protein [Clostridia bacterium]|nr:N-acyl homoserine lactonase family protein [Clostridia bacterium]
MKVYILNNGYLECDLNQLVANGTIGTVDDKTPAHKWIKAPVYVVLVDHPQAKVLYDTGCHPDAMKGYWPEALWKAFPYYGQAEHRLENQLKKVGLVPKDIDIVVQSHMHLDHAGNLSLFTHADVYVHKEDFAMGLISTHSNPDPSTHGAYIKADIEVPCRFKTITEDTELLPGIELISLPGHTPGVLGMVVKLKNSGMLIFPSDAIYRRENYGPPGRFSGIVYDSISFMKSIEKVRALATKGKGQVMFSHDWDFFQTMKLAPEYYD